MSRSASQEHSRSPGRQYTDEEWDRVKQPFYHFYIEKNLSLKESAKRMSDEYNFDATLRQWERRIAPEKWNFTKYANREDRLKQIHDSGKSLLEVGSRGRRRSIASDGRPSLNEDRNLRRFARRELSRDTRPRARSVSGMSTGSDQEMTGTSAAPSPAPSDFNAMESPGHTPFPTTDYDDSNEGWMSNTQFSQGSIPPRIEVYDHSQSDENTVLPIITLSEPRDLSHMAPSPIPMATQSQINVHYPPDQPDNRIYDSYQREPNDMYNQSFEHNMSMPPPLEMDDGWHTQNPFTGAGSKGSDVIPEFNFNQLSFQQMIDDGPSAESGHVAMNGPLDAFNNESLELQEPLPTPITPEDAMPDFDNTHADVHALLQEQSNTTMHMIAACLQGCQNVSGNESEMKNAIMRHLELLQMHVQATSEFPQNLVQHYADRHLRRRIRQGYSKYSEKHFSNSATRDAEYLRSFNAAEKED